MRKFLLTAGLALASAASIQAVEPAMFEDLQIVAISPDGSLSVSQLYGIVTIINNETGEQTVFGDPNALEYNIGFGHPISNNNVIVGSLGELPAYYKDGEWHTLPVIKEGMTNMAHSITPDGLRIVGFVGVAPVSIDDAATPMSAPCVWDLKEDGTYGEPVVLPYPKLDWTNRVPQYVMGLDISADGKTVIGQITDSQGMMHTIIYFTLNDENKWECHNNFQSLANPNNVQLPEYPGEAPEQPQVTDFMTEDNKASYNEAIAAWQATGTWDPETYPNFEDYMSADELAAYNAAMDKYQTEYQAWDEASNAFYTALESCGGTDMVFNNVLLSSDGKTAYSSAQIPGDDPTAWPPADKYTPVKFDLTNDTHTIYPINNILVSAVADDGTIMGASQSTTEPQQAYVYLPGSTEPISLMSYFETRDAQTYAWMQENMLHDYEGYDPETYEPIMFEDYPFTGVPRVTPDLKLVATSSQNYWDFNSSAICFSYILPDSSTGAVNGVAADKLIDEANAPVYNAQGIIVGRGTEALRNLPAGIYVIGSRKVVK